MQIWQAKLMKDLLTRYSEICDQDMALLSNKLSLEAMKKAIVPEDVGGIGSEAVEL